MAGAWVVVVFEALEGLLDPPLLCDALPDPVDWDEPESESGFGWGFGLAGGIARSLGPFGLGGLGGLGFTKSFGGCGGSGGLGLSLSTCGPGTGPACAAGATATAIPRPRIGPAASAAIRTVRLFFIAFIVFSWCLVVAAFPPF